MLFNRFFCIVICSILSPNTLANNRLIVSFIPKILSSDSSSISRLCPRITVPPFVLRKAQTLCSKISVSSSLFLNAINSIFSGGWLFNLPKLRDSNQPPSRKRCGHRFFFRCLLQNFIYFFIKF